MGGESSDWMADVGGKIPEHTYIHVEMDSGVCV